MLQQRPGVVAETPRPQPATIDPLARVGKSRAGQHPPGRRAAHPVVATTRSKILPFSAFDALPYGVRSLFATCRLAAM
jgi:hypothetical protein